MLAMLALTIGFLAIGIVAGLRAALAPTAVAWAARLGWLDLHASWLAFLGYRWTPWVLTLVALGELFNDKLPATPSRTTAPQFVARIASGALCGAAIGIPAGALPFGALLGAVGAVIGTRGGSAVRANLARAFVNDRPAALVEDVVAIVAAMAIVLTV